MHSIIVNDKQDQPVDKVTASKVCQEYLMSLPEYLSDNVGNTAADNGRYGGFYAAVPEERYTTQPILNRNDQYKLIAEHPCHSKVAWMHRPLVFYNKLGRRPILSERVNRAYFYWLVSDTGPWRTFEARKMTDAPEEYRGNELGFIYRYGWVWSDLDHPVNLQHNFLVASRALAEWPLMIQRWWKWQQVTGVNPSLVFAFLSLFKPVRTETHPGIYYKEFTIPTDSFPDSDVDLFKIHNQCHYDWCLDVNCHDEESVKRFVKGEPLKNRLSKNFSETGSYRPVNHIWGPTLSPYGEKSYASLLYKTYRDHFGLAQEPQKKLFSSLAQNTAWEMNVEDSGDHRRNWSLREYEIYQILKQEEERLGLK